MAPHNGDEIDNAT